MYRTEDKSTAIREIQRFLLIIGEVERDMQHITVDGFYSEETRLAVKYYQEIEGLSNTGKVDILTFNSLFLRSEEILADKENERQVNSKEKYPLRIGSYGSDVTTLNSILHDLSEFYFDLGAIAKDSFFSKETEDAIIKMQCHFKEDQNGTVTPRLMKRLKAELDALKNFKKN